MSEENPGIGIGLTICRQIIQHSRGKIIVKDRSNGYSMDAATILFTMHMTESDNDHKSPRPSSLVNNRDRNQLLNQCDLESSLNIEEILEHSKLEMDDSMEAVQLGEARDHKKSISSLRNPITYRAAAN